MNSNCEITLGVKLHFTKTIVIYIYLILLTNLYFLNINLYLKSINILIYTKKFKYGVFQRFFSPKFIVNMHLNMHL